ncbi:MAG: diacylglycerol kinase family protein [Candidatus Gottesmanbacteria bacterium]|nr:diacylglycerol kinase family protein [Candidatus Gottesmanbacteria bacterium]
MKEILRKHTISFKNAFAGLAWAIRTQPNFRIHLALSAIALGLSAYFRITRTEWAIIIFTIVLGLTAECMNTAIESMTDLITTEWRAEAKIAKDVAAGMMLTTAAGAVIVAIFVFAPYLGIGTHF